MEGRWSCGRFKANGRCRGWYGQLFRGNRNSRRDSRNAPLHRRRYRPNPTANEARARTGASSRPRDTLPFPRLSNRIREDHGRPSAPAGDVDAPSAVTNFRGVALPSRRRGAFPRPVLPSRRVGRHGARTLRVVQMRARRRRQSRSRWGLRRRRAPWPMGPRRATTEPRRASRNPGLHEGRRRAAPSTAVQRSLRKITKAKLPTRTKRTKGKPRRSPRGRRRE